MQVEQSLNVGTELPTQDGPPLTSAALAGFPSSAALVGLEFTSPVLVGLTKEEKAKELAAKRHAKARNLAEKQALKDAKTAELAAKKVTTASKPKAKKVGNLAPYNKSPPGVNAPIQYLPLSRTRAKGPMLNGPSGPSGANYKSPPASVPGSTGKGIACTPSRIGLVGDGTMYITAKE